MAPITPHITHHLWLALGFEKLIIDVSWPKVDKGALKSDELNFVIQVNGKLKGEFSAANDLSEDALIELATEYVGSHLQGKPIKKSIVVMHRQLINLVI